MVITVLFAEITCFLSDCHCGEHSKCEFEDGEKVCYCIEGYAELDGACTSEYIILYFLRLF